VRDPAREPGLPSDVTDEDWAFSTEQQSLVELVNRVLDRGVVAHGDVTISVAGVDLVYLGLNALLTSVSTARRTLEGRATHGPRIGASPHRAVEGGAAAEPRQPPVPSVSSRRASDPGDREPQLSTELVSLTRGLPERLEIDPDGVQRDLARLVLTLVELLRRVVEHQAVQRMDDDDLSEEQVERMGAALLALEAKLQEIKGVFGLADDELNIDLGPLGKLL
jgi:hypothetical protein